ncbi:MAG: response regulator, partial [Thermodesulfobacteriota bacterium]
MEKHSTENLTRNYVLVLVLLGLMALGSFIVMHVNTRSEESSAAVVNVSGRQRMLLERSALFSNHLIVGKSDKIRTKLIDVVESMERSHRGLISGDKALGLPGSPGEGARAVFYDTPHALDRQLVDYIKEVRALANAPAKELTFSNPHLVNIDSAADGRLLVALDALVREFQQESEANIARLSILQGFLMLVSILVLLLSALFIFHPMVGRIRENLDSLSRAEARTRAVVENMFDGLITFDLQGVIESFNNAAESMFGYSSPEICGQNILTLLPSLEDKEGKVTKLSLSSVVGARELFGRKRDGRTLPMEFSATEMQLGKKRMFIASVRDISERKRFEEEIIEKSRELEATSVYDRSFGVAMGLFSSTYNREKILNSTLKMLAENHSFPVSALYLYDEWNGSFICSASNGAGDELKREFNLDEGVIGQAASERRSIIMDRQSGSLSMTIETGITTFEPIATLVCPIFYQDRIMGVMALGSSRHISEREGLFIERLSSQLGVALNNLSQYSSLKELSEQLKLKGNEITRKNTELEQANKLKSEFLANMSHELRTPLNAIIGFSEVLKDGVIGKLTQEQVEYITDIYQSGHHLLSLVNDILDLAKIEAGKMTYDPEEANLREILENSMSVIRERAIEKRIGLKLKIQKGFDIVTVDPRKFKQIIYNLLSNAVKFTPEGGAVSVDARKRSSGGREYCVLSVTDTGIGISKDGIEKLFTPFVQLDGSISREHEGTGLGLALVQRLVALHRGTLDVKSKVGEGSTFTINVPSWTSERDDLEEVDLTVTSAKEESEESPVLSATKVLVIDDDDMASNLIRLQLEEEGFKVVRVVTAEQGLKEALRSTPDLIVLDILLPGMSGWEFLERTKEHPTLASVPVVIVSVVGESNKNRGFSLGAAKVLQKPLEKASLVKALSETGVLGKEQGRETTVLVIDDDHKAVDIVCRHLEDSGVRALRAYGGRDGIDTAISEVPDLILLDLMMPDVTGFDVVDALSLRENTSGIPIIILTAKKITEQDRKILNSGVTRIVQKRGFEEKAFFAEVKRALVGRFKGEETGFTQDTLFSQG